MKIFGVGLGKTGTTSLHFALEALGFRSIHCCFRVLQAISEEREAENLLLSLVEDFDAFIDYPIWCFYKQLDRQYPGSKFILTVRDPDDLYDSTRRHAREYNKRQRAEGGGALWHVLGSRRLFRAACRAHNASVVRHFAGRESQLLVLNIFAPGVDPWLPLCDFLSKTVPKVPFPRLNSAGDRALTFIRTQAVPPEPWEKSFGYLRKLGLGQVLQRGLVRLLSRAP